MSVYKVLAIDGGGIRGVIPARVLQAIEERCDRPIASCFDAIAGTSTGGIIALGLSCRADDGAPRYSARDMVSFYLDNGPTIFPHHSALHRVEDVVVAKYSPGPLEGVLQGHFGERMLSEALTEVVIPSYDISKPGPFFFKREYARQTDDEGGTQDSPIWRVARATSAAPTYFPPATLQLTAAGPVHALVDGGTFANNPAAAVYADALRWAKQGNHDQLFVLSVGTGQPPQRPGSGPIPIAAGGGHGWGLAEWAVPILEIVLDGAAKAVEYEMAQINAQGADPLEYHRLQSDLPTASHALDDASPANLVKLQADAETLIAETGAQLDAVCAALTA